MSETSAIKTALNLLHLPAGLRRIRTAPLPPDVNALLRMVAGDEEEIAKAACLTERPPAVIRDAAVFYIEQILLSPGSDSYRVLGATPEASSQQLRRNMALLMSWLHPDKDVTGERAVFAARVTRAWTDLRSPDRRAAYDATLRDAHGSNRGQSSHTPKLPRSGPRKDGGARALRPPPGPQSSWTYQDDRLHRAERTTLLRRGWRALRRALRPGATL